MTVIDSADKDMALSERKDYPCARSGQSLTYDPKSDRLFLFGGRKNKKAEGDLNDFWEYSLKGNTWHLAEHLMAKDASMIGLKQVYQVNSIVNGWKKQASVVPKQQSVHDYTSPKERANSNRSLAMTGM